ncbi:uncharacterized protein MELLADRAFT_59206 [Melampsora larici-populina 98AG31]|uniref:Uncharacterized protein n=1 Tax=Melampsora larici-populina (strain 98AG31 / pathotype 3-4-7) TaxID=747676 RepID=F4R5F4_MELLP|nr:uncharacterized protein MELLADRAFT_59206 [Melampsora larici-populina 98AG31]EGG12036.1 hypothetical protein MELLADRAFT_59206 [Melampsora larici-populina 98AG31]
MPAQKRTRVVKKPVEKKPTQKTHLVRDQRMITSHIIGFFGFLEEVKHVEADDDFRLWKLLNSSDEELKKAAKMIKKKRTKVEETDNQRFEATARDLNSSISAEAHKNLDDHQSEMNKLNGKIKTWIETEDESNEERVFQRLLMRNYEPQIKQLSTNIQALSNMSEVDNNWEETAQDLLKDVEARPSLLKDVSESLTNEAKKSCRLHLQNLKTSDGKIFENDSYDQMEKLLHKNMSLWF